MKKILVAIFGLFLLTGCNEDNKTTSVIEEVTIGEILQKLDGTECVLTFAAHYNNPRYGITQQEFIIEQTNITDREYQYFKRDKISFRRQDIGLEVYITEENYKLIENLDCKEGE